MILQALYELAQAEELIGDPDFEYKPVSWVIRLREDGTLVNIEDHRRDMNEGKTGKGGKPVKPKWTGKDELVPVQPIRTSGDLAFFLVDKAEYVFGIDPAGGRSAAKLTARGGLFREAVETCTAESDDAGVRAVATFLRSLAEGKKAHFPEDAAANELFAFKVGEGPFVHLRPAVKAWWKSRREIAGGDGEARYRCLVTGEPIHDVELFPLIKRVPGGTPSGVALVSHNASAFESYGLSGNDNAPVSRAASQAVSTALNRLLDPEPINGRGEHLSRRFIRLSPDTAVVYWSPQGDPHALDAIFGLTEAESADAVADVFRSIWRGEMPSLRDPSRLYAMTIMGTQGRAVVRDYLETTVTEALANLARHFAALSIVRNANPARGKDQSPAIPLRALMDALSAPGRDAQVPSAIAAGFIHAALRGGDYPASILQRALLRERAEAAGDEWADSARRDAHASLIKAVLTRNHDLEVKPRMDESNTNSGYLLGRLLAVLEDTQRLASGGVNASIKDKFYGAASATPAAVFPSMMDLFHKHARKAREARPGAVVIREKLADSILAGLDQIPVHLVLADQGMFVLGYHHQRHALYNKPASQEESK